MNTDLIAQLLSGAVATVTVEPSGRSRVDDPPPGAILSGAFNPLHQGHLGMATAAAQLTGLPASFELAVVNADKGALDAAEIARRIVQFTGRHTLTLSREPLFDGKAPLYPGRCFVLGYDTAIRLLAPRYYGGEAEMAAAFATIAGYGCRFLIAGRLIDNIFRTLNDLAIPAGFSELFTAIPPELFRADISSTQLRAGRK